MMVVLGEVLGNELLCDKVVLRKLVVVILVLMKVVGVNSMVMDVKGNKVFVCDNGIGVRLISCYIVESDV